MADQAPAADTLGNLLLLPVARADSKDRTAVDELSGAVQPLQIYTTAIIEV